MGEMSDTAGLGVCLVDLRNSTVTYLACPRCDATAVECTTAPHAHRCHNCGEEGLVD